MPMKLTVRKTIPFVEDVCVSGTEEVLAIGGIIEQQQQCTGNYFWSINDIGDAICKSWNMYLAEA